MLDQALHKLSNKIKDMYSDLLIIVAIYDVILEIKYILSSSWAHILNRSTLNTVQNTAQGEPAVSYR